MKNFIMGLLIGIFGTYCYLTQGGPFGGLIGDFWARASSPPVHRHVP